MTNDLIAHCPECEEAMELHALPVERGFSAFGCEFLLRRWVKKPLCVECESERRYAGQRRGEESAFEVGMERGYERAMEARRGEW